MSKQHKNQPFNDAKELDIHSRIAKKAVTNSFEYGKLPPAAIDLEEAVLGACMLEKDAIVRVADIIKKSDVFYKQSHVNVYEAILALEKEGEAIDILTVTNKLKKLGTLDLIGGPYFIAQLTSRVGSAANVEYHCRILMEKYIKRQTILNCSQTIAEAFEESCDCFDLLDNQAERQKNVEDQLIQAEESNTLTMYPEYASEIETIMGSTGELLGVATTCDCLDEITNGWQPSWHIVVASRPGMGKTAFALSNIRRICGEQKKSVGFISIEMPKSELIGRQVSIETGLETSHIRSRNAPPQIFDYIHQTADLYYDRVNDVPLLHVNDTGSITFTQLRAQAKRWKNKYDIQVLFIDFLQEIKYDLGVGSTRTSEIDRIANGLKALAKELKIPVISLAQLNRKVEDTPYKRPNLSHLRESGAIEASADMVIFLYRPEYYKDQGESGFEFIRMNDQDTDIRSAGKAELIIAKNRHGAVCTKVVNFENSTAFYYDNDRKWHIKKNPIIGKEVSEKKDSITNDNEVPF